MSDLEKLSTSALEEDNASKTGFLERVARNSKKIAVGITAGVAAVAGAIEIGRNFNIDPAMAESPYAQEANYDGQSPIDTTTTTDTAPPTRTIGTETEPMPVPPTLTTPAATTPAPRPGEGANPDTDTLRWFYDGTLPQGHTVKRRQKLPVSFDINEAGLKVTTYLKSHKGLTLPHKGSRPDWHPDLTTHLPTWDLANSIPAAPTEGKPPTYETKHLNFNLTVPAKAKKGAKRCIDLVILATDGVKVESREYDQCYTVTVPKKHKKKTHKK
jgi:hypothetical protein